MADFVLRATLTPLDRSRIMQGVAADPLNGDFYVAQVQDVADDAVDDMTVSHFVNGIPVSTMNLPGGGHGDLLTVERVGSTVFCIFRYAGLSASHDVSGTWVRLPYTAGKTWTSAQALVYAFSGPPQTTPGRAAWNQGEAYYNGAWYRSYGSPFFADGTSGAYPSIPPYVQKIVGGAVVETQTIVHLGRDAAGLPVGGRTEPEGLSIYFADGEAYLLVGIAIQRKGNYQFQVWTQLLDVGAAPAGPVPSYQAPVTPPATSRRAMRFYVADSLTGAILGQLYPTDWEITEPRLGASTGSITVRLPDTPDEIAALRSLTVPRMRWIAIQDDLGQFVFGGPIPKRGVRNGQTVVIPVVDWRSWFYLTPIRPNTNGTRRTYTKTKTKAGDKRVEQTVIMTDLAKLALATTGRPVMAVDTVKTTNIKREITGLMLERSVGELLDSVMNRDRACEWWTYITADTAMTKLIPHFAVAWPERRRSDEPILLQYRIGTAERPGGGTVTDFTPNEPESTFTRVWATGDGQPPKQPFSFAETPSMRKGTDLAWEAIVTSDSKTKAGVYDFAAAQIKGAAVLGAIECSVTAERIPLSRIAPGDRARVDIDDGWNRFAVNAARITQRVMSGGAGRPTVQRLTVNLDDSRSPDDPSLIPGFPTS